MRPARNRGFTYRETIDQRFEGSTVLAHLAGRYDHSRPEVWGCRIDAGEVLVDGSPAARGQLLRRGAQLVWNRPPWIEPAVPLSYAIVHEDEHLLAVAKPSGLPTVPAGGFLEHTLLTLVRRRRPAASPAHRLGRGTSGLVLFGCTSEARRGLAAAWRQGKVRKVYRARVLGTPDPPEFTVTVPIGPVPHPVLGTVHAATPGGRESRSHVRLLEAAGDESTVEVVIETGRPHQVRIHLAASGHPLAGDPLYGPGGVPDPGNGTLPGALGYHLHAAELQLRHPATGQALRLECGLPPRLRPG